MSSGLCKKVEGAVFPFQVESLEDGVDDAVHAGHIDEADHGPGSSSYFQETAFNDIGGADLLPQMPGQGKKRQQFRQIAFQAPFGILKQRQQYLHDGLGSFKAATERRAPAEIACDRNCTN